MMDLFPQRQNKIIKSIYTVIWLPDMCDIGIFILITFYTHGKAFGAYLVKRRFESGIIPDGLQKLLHVPCLICDVMRDYRTSRRNQVFQ
jgi:hypothetical protein